MKNTLGDPTCRGFRELIRSLAVSRDENALAPEDSDGREVVEHNFTFQSISARVQDWRPSDL